MLREVLRAVQAACLAPEGGGRREGGKRGRGNNAVQSNAKQCKASMIAAQVERTSGNEDSIRSMLCECMCCAEVVK